MRILISVTHLLGVGHLARSLALGRGLAAAGHLVRLVSGGRPVPTMRTDGLDFVQLPPVHCLDADFKALIGADGRPVDAAFRAARAQALTEIFEAFHPDVVVTETYPFGRRRLADEFRALIEAAEARSDRPAVLASVRDILNPPSKPERAEAADAVVARFYDGVLVHGDEAATPLGRSWPVGARLEWRLVYTGYVSEADASLDAGLPRGGIVVSGGGGVAGMRLFEAAIEAARLDPAGRAWRVLVGHGVGEPDFTRLAAGASGNLVVERARPDFRRLLVQADASISQAGYNTVLDLGLTGVPAVLVPYEDGLEAEQRLRAEGLHERGWATLLRQRDLTPASLLAALETETTRIRPSGRVIELTGVAGSVAAVEAAAERARRTAQAWADLRARLDAIAGAGRTTELWWRDDDAAEPSPALDRLLALARRLRMPLALAVSPMLAGDALAARLAGEPDIAILLHGIAHANHAPAGQKKRELGDRPLAELLSALHDGLAVLRERFGAAALPVLVPPWNRIDADLVPHLASLGVVGLSTFGPRPAPRRDGLALANTHCDPVFWKAGGGLAPEAEMLERLAADLERGEPVGLLTHHLVQDERTWRFVERLTALLAAHPAVRPLAAADLFAAAGPSPEAGARL